MLVFLLFGAQLALAESVTLTLQKQDGTALESAVAYVEASQLETPVSAANQAKAPPALPDVVVTQKDQEFLPFVSVVRKGATVRFTNEDSVKHNIYSFSSEEKLNFPLHGAGTVNTKSFSRLGEVELGCNIHDWMQAHLYVVDTPVYGVSGKDGKVTLAGVPAKGAKVTVWHPHLREKGTLPSVLFQPGKPVDPLRLQVKSVKKPPRETY